VTSTIFGGSPVECVRVALLEYLKLGVRIQRLKHVEQQESCDWPTPIVLFTVELISSKFMDSGKNVEAEVGVARNEPLLAQERLWNCLVVFPNVGIHRAGNSTKRESPCDCMLAANCALMMVASDGEVGELSDTPLNSSGDN